MYKKVKLVMLPTNEKAMIIRRKITNELKISSLNNPQLWDCQHLYILSDEEINHKGKHYLKTETGYKEILASTDTSLTIEGKCCCMKPESGGCYQCNKSLPQIPQSFIEYFIFEYNKGNTITEVMVEYESIGAYANPKYNSDYQLKINPNNTINIKPIKDSYSRDEVIKLIKLFANNYAYASNDVGYNKWIKENL